MSTMLEWSTDEARAAVPHRYRPTIPTAKGRGEFFVGRQTELETLHTRHARDPAVVAASDLKEHDPAKASFITVIHNAPGAGKSALTDQLVEEHEKLGGAIIPLSPSALRNDAALRSGLEKLEPIKIGGMLRKIGIAIDVGATAIGANAVQAVIKAVQALGSEFVKAIDSPTTARIVARVSRMRGQASGMDLMRALGEATDGRAIIVIDEAQELGEETGPVGQETPDETATILQQLGDPSERVRLHLRSGGIIMTGLPDTEHRLLELHKSRAFSMPLRPLSHAEVRMLLDQAWDAAWYGPADRDRTQGRHRGVSAVLDTLSRDFCVWTHHAYSAAYSTFGVVRRIRQRASKAEQEKDIPPEPPQEICNWIRTYAALEACQLYDRTARLAANYVGPDGTRVIIEEINTTGTVLDTTLRQLFEGARQPDGLNTIDRIDDATAKLRLMHLGLIIPERDGAGNLTGNMAVPIPSLQQYLTATGGKAARPLERTEMEEEPRKLPNYLDWVPPEERGSHPGDSGTTDD